MYKVIEALLILHNMCIELKDKPEDIWGFFDTDDDDDDDDDDKEVEDPDHDNVANEMLEVIPDRETDGWLKKQGRRKRMIILNDLFPLD
jgi:hypothetical protein